MSTEITVFQINGKLTLGENIADNGGIRQSFMAYQMHTKQHGVERKLPGFEDFTPEQLFFLSYGNVSCSFISFVIYTISK